VADDIKATDAGQRYAQALFDLADDNGALPAVEADLRSLKTMLAESRDLSRLLASPAFSGEDRAKGLKAVAAKAKFSPITLKFLGLLAANGRTALLQSAITSFLALSAKRRGVVAAEVTTAIALTPAQTKGVAAALRTALGKDPEISTRVDPTMLGGMKVRVGSRLFDASLKSRLDSLKFALKRA
jgi:F-type H+-transporting ATPase subunit delta